MKTIRTDRARKAFLEVFSGSCNASAAARAAGISRTAVYAWRNDDPEFAKDWDEAEQEAIDGLEETAWNRARIDKSDRMLEILLKAHRPEKYVERIRSELTGKDGNPILIEQVHEDADAFTRAIAGIAARGPARSGAGEAAD